MTSKKSSVKKATPKKTTKKPMLKKTAKKAAPKKAAKKGIRGLRSWKVVCNIEGVIGSGLTLQQATALSNSHNLTPGHQSTYTSSQRLL
ncbi:MAG: hypothetical protein QM791_18560 [Ferruginibacter sp.]